MSSPSDIGWYRCQTASIGTVTPSANLTVERVTQAILADVPEVSGHYARTPVSGDRDPVPGDYDWTGMMQASALLGDAKVDVILWNGSKGASLGFAIDDTLCERITALTGRPALTSITALRAVLTAKRYKRVAIVSPYNAAYHAKLVRGFETAGYQTVADAHGGIDDNLAYSSIPDATIEAMITDVATARPDCILTICTNFPAAHLVGKLEQKTGLPIYDSVSIGVCGALQAIGISTARAARWGSAFAAPSSH
jgi:maleate isomerase